MKMCRYCGGLVEVGQGERGSYCSMDCYNAAEGFYKGLETERKKGKISLDAVMAKGGDISDGGRGAAELRCEREVNAADIMQTASDIHPKLPGALVLLAAGKTQAQAAALVGLNKGDLSTKLKQLRNTLSASDL